MLTGDHFEAGEFWVVAGTDTFHFAPHLGIREIGGARDSVTDALETGAVGLKGLAKFIDGMSPRIAKTL